jgi:GNAT superfamily N-acetyltransferase
VNLSIGAARVEDAEPLARLLNLLGYPSTAEQVVDRLGHWDAEPRSAVLAAHDGAELLGCLAVHSSPLFELTGRSARIQALVVATAGRRSGVGRALVAAAEKLARDWGCRMIEVTSARDRVDAHAFYQQLGYVDQCARSGRFLKELAPPTA